MISAFCRVLLNETCVLNGLAITRVPTHRSSNTGTDAKVDKQERRNMVNNAAEEIGSWIDAGFLTNGQKWIESWFRYDLKWSSGEQRYITIPQRSLKPLCNASLREAETLKLALFIAATRLESSAPMPKPLQDLVVEFLKIHIEIPRNSPGRPSKWGRDFIVCRLIIDIIRAEERLATQKLQLPSNKLRTTSASKIVQEAIELSEIENISVSTIQKIWSEKRDAYKDFWGNFIATHFDDIDDVRRV